VDSARQYRAGDLADVHPPDLRDYSADGPQHHLVGALVVTVAVIATAEVARPLRFVNIALGVWLIAAPWLLPGGFMLAGWAGVAAGLALIALSLPRGERSRDNCASWDRFVL